jgi:hypothetical protein
MWSVRSVHEATAATVDATVVLGAIVEEIVDHDVRKDLLPTRSNLFRPQRVKRRIRIDKKESNK